MSLNLADQWVGDNEEQGNGSFWINTRLWVSVAWINMDTACLKHLALAMHDGTAGSAHIYYC